MWQYQNTDELYHYGIPGMRWGVRRYHNKDGTLNSQGRAKKAEKILTDINRFNDEYKNKIKAMSNGIKGRKKPNASKRKSIEKRIKTGKKLGLGAYIPMVSSIGLAGAKASLSFGQPIAASIFGTAAIIGTTQGLKEIYNIKNTDKILKKKISKGKKELNKLGYNLITKDTNFDYTYSYNGFKTQYNTTKVKRYGILKNKRR